MSERFDVAVVGCGPAGIAAAVTAAEAGAHVAIVDETSRRGGNIWHAAPDTVPHRARPWFARLKAANVTIFAATSIIDAEPTGRLHTTRGSIETGRLVLACGARELYLPFPGWTLPGVTGVGGLQALVHDGLDVTGQRVVVAGTGPLLLQVASTLRRHGARVLRVAEQASRANLLRLGRTLSPSKMKQALGLFTPTLRTLQWVVSAHGSHRVERVNLRMPSGDESIDVDRLAVGYSLVPNLELPLRLGCEMSDTGVQVDAEQRTSVDRIFAAGEVCGVKGAQGALADGICAGAAALGVAAPAEARRSRDLERRFGARLGQAFALRPDLSRLASPETLVCRCEDVSFGRLAVHEDWTSAKLHTRCGMGSCQGRVCGAATRHLFGWGPSGVRPPLVPVPISALLNERMPT